MLGIILCGGKSLRMEADKGLLVHQDELWAQIALAKLSLLGIPVKLSVNSAQMLPYTAHFNAQQLIVDDPLINLNGPLLGLLSAHLRAPDEDLFLLACDLLLMEHRVLEKMLYSYRSMGGAEAYIFTKDGQREPMCGIYTAKGLKNIMLKLQTTGLEKHSMKFMLGNLKVFEMELTGNDHLFFRNFNSHADINGL